MDMQVLHKVGIFFAGTAVIAAGVLGVVMNALGAGLTSTDVQLSSYDTGANVTATVLFTTIGGIPANGKIKVTFPNGFNVAGANNGTCANMDGTFATSVNGQVVTITRQNNGSPRSNAAESCTIQGVVNPSVAGQGGTYTIQTTDGADLQIDADAAVASDNILAALLSNVNVEPASLVQSTTNVVTVTFTTKNALENNGKIKVTFPNGFNVSGASGGACSSMDGSFATSVNGQEVTLTRSGGSVANAAPHTCTIGNIVNPAATGSTGTYTIQTTTNSNQLHDTNSNVPADTITAGAATLTGTNVQPASLETGATSVVTISFTTTTATPANGKIRVAFPAGFNVSGANGGTCSTMDGTFATSVSGQEVTITRQNDGTEQGTGAETCTVNGVTNPSVAGPSGTYTIQTLNNANGVINADAAVASDNILAAVLANVNVQPASLVQSTTNVVTVTFTTKNALENNGKIKVTFPNGFNVSGANNGTCSSMDGSFATSVNGQEVTLTRSGGSVANAAPHTCTIGNIVNPAATGSTGTYSMQTTTNSNQLHDIATNIAADTIIGASAALTGTNVQPASLVAGALGQVTISFATTNTIPANGKIKVIFPNGFNVSGANGGACSTMDGSFATSVNGQEVTLTRQNNGTQQTANAESCTVNNVVNPNIAGPTGTYTIQTTDNANSILDSDAAVAADTITAGALSGVNVEPGVLTTGTFTTVTITFGTANALESDGKIKVAFPNGFNVASANGGMCSSMNGSFATGVNGQTVTLTRSGGTTANSGSHSCTINNVGNPSVSGTPGTYAVTTTTALDGVHDTNNAVASDTFTPSLLTGVNVQPATNTAGALGTATVTFTTINTVKETDAISVTFPTGFNVSGASSGTCSSMDGSFATSINGQIVTLTRSGGTGANPGPQTCTIGGVRNPSIAGTTGVYAVATEVPGGGGGIRDRNAAVPGDAISAASLASANVEPVIKRTRIATTISLTFTTANALESDGKIKITFPTGFNVAGATSGLCTSMDGAFATSVSGQIVTLTRSGGSVANAGAHACAISGVITPSIVGLSGLYAISTTDANDALHDVNTAIAGDIFSSSTETSPTTSSSSTTSASYNVLVTGPLAGEVFLAGERLPIAWSTAGSTTTPSFVNLWYSTDGGTFWTRIIANTANDGGYIWAAPEVNASSVVVKVEASDLASVLASDTSEAFTLGSGDPEETEVETETEEQLPEETETEAEEESPEEEVPAAEESPVVPEDETITVGSFVRLQDSSDVFFIEEGGVKRRFPDAQTFFTYASSFNEVQVVSAEALAAYTEGDVMPPKSGAVLVKVVSDERVYALEGVGTFLRLRWITSETVASAIYGSNWADYVIDILADVFDRITVGEDVTSPENAPAEGAEGMQKRTDLNGR